VTTTTIRISHQTHAALRDMAGQSGLTMLQVLEQAVAVYRRQRSGRSMRRQTKSVEWDQLQEAGGVGCDPAR
jgi:predicted transcriptional regulator